MNGMKFVMLYASCLAVFIVVDFTWLYFMVGFFYRKQLGHLLAPSPDWLPAFIFYLLFVLGNVIFVVLPSVQTQSLNTVILKGILFGLVTYGTYDLTNQATLTEWPPAVTVVDLTWGMVLSTLVGFSGYMIEPILPVS